ncbi:hypothetical protein B0T22DRAFT_455587 [Podospora appendiculata]|uniref:Uncharacterized protein n=1 Tax=Podospora appendiculata TaxID=314037 RepID=A0AAE0XLC2_9PEZI|nr:hypothetical protein B0T22DRAFT_455587 [Podospora appendiculata]
MSRLIGAASPMTERAIVADLAFLVLFLVFLWLAGWLADVPVPNHLMICFFSSRIPSITVLAERGSRLNEPSFACGRRSWERFVWDRDMDAVVGNVGNGRRKGGRAAYQTNDDRRPKAFVPSLPLLASAALIARYFPRYRFLPYSSICICQASTMHVIFFVRLSFVLSVCRLPADANTTL